MLTLCKASDNISKSTPKGASSNYYVEPFVPEKKLNLINEWLRGHNLNELPVDMLPSIGFLFTDGDKYYGCCFLYSTDSSICILEGCLSDPKDKQNIIANNFNKFLREMEVIAKSIGYTHIKIFASVRPHIKKLENADYTKGSNCVEMSKDL